MKLSIIDEVLDGNFQSFMEERVPIPAYIEKTVGQAETKLLNTMNKEQEKLFDDYRFECFAILAEHERLHFKKGVRFGLMLATEAYSMEFGGNEDIFREMSADSSAEKTS